MSHFVNTHNDDETPGTPLILSHLMLTFMRETKMSINSKSLLIAQLITAYPN